MIRRSASVFVVLILLIGTVVVPGTPAPTVQPPLRQGQPQMAQLQLPPGTLRTADEMVAFDATHALTRAPGGPRSVHARPVMDAAAYAAAKKAAAEAPRLAKPAIPAAPRAPLAAAILNCDGEDQIQSANFGFIWAPPDADGDYGFSPTAHTLQFVQVTNGHLTVWDAVHAFLTACSSSSRVFDVSLNGFFGYAGAALFDPRVVHDGTYSRWVVSADAFAEASGAQFQFMAVSVSDDARGPYFEFAFDTTGLTCPGCFWDFPQLGMDDQAVILTANVFNPNGSFCCSRWVFINKQHMYYGLGQFFCFAFGGIIDALGSWAPPKVLDLNPLTWIVEATPGGSALQLASLAATGQICPLFISFPAVTVAAYAVPPNAPQPNSTQVLDTLDARFQNRSTQISNLLWNVHTINLVGFAAPILRRIDTSTATATSAFFFASGTSFDWNPSVTVNFGGSVAVTWSATDPPAGKNAQVRTGLCAGGIAICSPGAGLLVFQSSVPYTGFRWGDYSYAVIDGSGTITGGVNEEINNPNDISGNTWGTRFFVAQFP